MNDKSTKKNRPNDKKKYYSHLIDAFQINLPAALSKTEQEMYEINRERTNLRYKYSISTDEEIRFEIEKLKSLLEDRLKEIKEENKKLKEKEKENLKIGRKYHKEKILAGVCRLEIYNV